jgi:hypothetical protein
MHRLETKIEMEVTICCNKSSQQTSWTRFVARNCRLNFLVPGLCMLYHNFYCTCFLLLPIDKAWSQVFV